MRFKIRIYLNSDINCVYTYIDIFALTSSTGLTVTIWT